MAILTQVTQLTDGIDTVTAKDIMDTQETAINANTNATSAVSTANEAKAAVAGKLSTDNIKAGSNITVSVDGNDVTINGTGGSEVTIRRWS